MHEEYKSDYELLIKHSKYSILIAEYLLNNGAKTHNELCEFLHIKKNTLSNIISKLEPFNIFMVRRIRKNIYYSLNAKGYDFIHYRFN